MKVYIVYEDNIYDPEEHEICATREIAELYAARRTEASRVLWERRGWSCNAETFAIVEVDVLTEGPES